MYLFLSFHAVAPHFDYYKIIVAIMPIQQYLMKAIKRIVVDPFCMRQFKEGSCGFIDYDVKKFEEIANQNYQTAEIFDGYAPFCKHIFIENFTPSLQSTIPITPENEHLLTSCYEARTEKELPVLRRFFPKDKVTLQRAKFLDLILYSKEQIQKENEAMGQEDPNKDIEYDYGIISVKFEDEAKETPMDPITMMRNALGKEEGGSGVSLSREKYLESVKYWEKYATVK